MRSIVVVPADACPQVRQLLSASGWNVEPATPATKSGVDDALTVAMADDPVLFVPAGACIAPRLKRILVVHEGSPAIAPGTEAAEELARTTGAKLTVVHVPAATPPSEPGSLPAPRLVDQSHHAWTAWRREFTRRFLSRNDGAAADLQIAFGAPGPSILRVAHDLDTNLIVVTWKGRPELGHAVILKHVMSLASSPVLLLKEHDDRQGAATSAGLTIL